MNILFYDLESNGFARFKNPSDVNHRTGRCIQLAWELTNEVGQVISEHTYLIKPNGWVIPREDFWIRNGFYQKKNEEEGFPIVQVLQLFLLDFNKCELLVAHNQNFDRKILFAEFCRAKILLSNQPHEVCTMKESKQHCGLKDVRGNLKPPKLSELYHKLFEKDFEGAHDALSDVRACRECFFELVHRNIIQLPQTV